MLSEVQSVIGIDYKMVMKMHTLYLCIKVNVNIPTYINLIYSINVFF